MTQEITVQPTAAGQETPLPCDLQAELANHCWMCHGAVPQYTAPMKLTAVEDFQARSSGDPSVTVAQRVEARIHDAQRPMPPRPFSSLQGSDLDVLDTWIAAGAQARGPANCPTPATPMAAEPKGMMPPVAGTLASVGNSVDAGAPIAGQPSAAPPALKCVPLRAHGTGTSAAFRASEAKDLLQCFEFDAPMGSKEVYGVSFRPHIDNTNIVHHALLYQHSDHVPNGEIAECVRVYANSSLVSAWAPGTGAMDLPDDVGIQLTPAGYTLEVHYNGSGDDQSGFDVCYDEKPRAQTAAMHWLGTTNIDGVSATGTCRPSTRKPIYTLKYWPHMHLAGKHIKVIINRANGMAETFHDAPFDFNNQLLYDTDKVIQPGDTITTTCDYSKPVVYGEGTNTEMCFVVVLAYPVGALTQPGGTRFATNQCIEGNG